MEEPCSLNSLLDKTPWLFANTRLSQPRLQGCSESLAGFPECDTALKPVVIHESLHYFVYDALLFPALRRCVVLRASIVTKLRDAQHTNCKIIFVKANNKIVKLVKSVFFNPFKETRHAQYYDLFIFKYTTVSLNYRPNTIKHLIENSGLSEMFSIIF